MSIVIKEVKSKHDLNMFIRFPIKLYRNNPYYVPPLIKEEKSNLKASSNPALEFCEAKYWLALDKGKVVGRIGGIINRRENETLNEKLAHFSWFDLKPDPEVGKAAARYRRRARSHHRYVVGLCGGERGRARASRQPGGHGQ